MAQADIHLKIDGVPGESKDAKHTDEIDVESWSWGASNPGSMGTGGGGGTGKVSFTDLTFTHRMDKASPVLWLYACNGKHIPEATLTASKQGEKAEIFLTVKMNDIIVTSVSTGGSSGGGSVPMESVSLQFAKAVMDYCPQKEDGTLDAPVNFGWDIKKNEKV
jgi:type VI secretion system secreted protein Hcp